MSFTFAAAGLWLAGFGSSWSLFVGYGVIFGAANGLAYGFALQLSARIMPLRAGFAMGVTTACYGLGAVVGAQGLALLSDSLDAWMALRIHAGIFLVAAPALSLLVYASGVRYGESAPAHEPESTKLAWGRIAHYWFAYGCACAAGLMAIAHAEPFLAGLGGSTRLFAVTGVAAMGLGNVAAGVAAGLAADRMSPSKLIIGLPLISSCGLVAAATLNNVLPGVAAIVIIGFCYGALIAIYPLVIGREFGARQSARAYGRIFTAWGLAGLIAPTVAGTLFDLTGSYQSPLMLAVMLSIGSALLAWRLKPLHQIERHVLCGHDD